jgi:hypothetical protein
MDSKKPSSMGNSIIIVAKGGGVIFSSDGKKLTNRKAPRKHKMHKTIVNEYFEEMRKFNDNVFWDKTLMKFSRNLFPKDFRYTNSTLYYKVKSKKHKDELFVNTENLEQTFEKLIDFLRSKGIIPITDVNDDYEQYIINTEKKEIKTWKEAGKLKGLMIFQYIKFMRDKFELDSKESKQLESLLKISLYNDIIKTDNIVIRTERISKIVGLEWSEKERIFRIDSTELDHIKFSKSNSDKDADNFYTISSYSDDNNFTIGSEIRTLDISKEWADFLKNIYS